MKPVIVARLFIPNSFAHTTGRRLMNQHAMRPLRIANTRMLAYVFANVQHTICMKPPKKNDRKKAFIAPR